MHAIVRTYTGPKAKDLHALLIERKDDVAGVLRGVSGLVSYDIIETPDGCITVTVCQDKGGAQDSLARAKDWLTKNAAHLGISGPSSAVDGPIGLHIS
jgi:hypothetical protein